jgi:hypothetical protein
MGEKLIAILLFSKTITPWFHHLLKQLMAEEIENQRDSLSLPWKL